MNEVHFWLLFGKLQIFLVQVEIYTNLIFFSSFRFRSKVHCIIYFSKNVNESHIFFIELWRPVNDVSIHKKMKTFSLNLQQ